jgi:trehalose/maltose hydrolase-like predicted phosphorylase
MGNAAGGIHMAAQGGIWQAVVCGFGGLHLNRDGLRIAPRLPATWASLAYRVLWRGSRVRIAVQQEGSVTATLEAGPSLVVRIGRAARQLTIGETWTTRVSGQTPRRKEAGHE